MAKLYFNYGTMSSSKTAQLLIKAHSFEEMGIQLLCIKPAIDTRDGNDIIKSRVGIQRECVSVDSTHDLYDFIKRYKDNVESQGFKSPEWMFVDEAQFLTREQVNQLANVVDDFGINIMCYGLRTDFETKFFDGSMRLMEIADEINEIKSACQCGRKAIVNARLDSNGNLVEAGEQIAIGGDDKYVTLCRKCYHRRLREQHSIE